MIFQKALQDLEKRGIRVYLIGVKAPLRLKLKRAGMGAVRGSRRFVARPTEAARFIREELAEQAQDTATV